MHLCAVWQHNIILDGKNEMGFSSPQDLNLMTMTVSNNAACAVCIGNFPQNWLQKISFNVEYLSGCGLAIVLHTTQHC